MKIKILGTEGLVVARVFGNIIQSSRNDSAVIERSDFKEFSKQSLDWFLPMYGFDIEELQSIMNCLYNDDDTPLTDKNGMEIKENWSKLSSVAILGYCKEVLYYLASEEVIFAPTNLWEGMPLADAIQKLLLANPNFDIKQLAKLVNNNPSFNLEG